MTETAPETALDKTFDPARIEAKWYAHWEGNGLFRPERPNAQPFTIVNPPPNVTGSLHVGHALDNTLQDVVIRYERLRGKDALWVVGTDHAGIATQMVVERQMEARQDKRTNYTREQFIDKVWEWKAESGGTITGQLRRLGCSMDWSREQFTMDPHFTKAVVKVFVDLYNQKLIYRDKRLVNWDPKLKTAISDLEVETREVQGGFWHFKYPLSDGSGHIAVATTRPETMLADMAVAVNPNDARYKPLLERKATVTLPITGREIPIVADDHADPELGSGAVKITPGHDFNDFEVGKRAGIAPAQMLNMLDAEARVCQTADGLIPEEYLGLDRFEARETIVAEMKDLGFLIPHVTRDKEGNAVEHDAEPRTIQTPYGDRGGVVIEPWLTDQWYVDAATLAGPAIEAVKSGAIEIVPKTWEKTYFNWMENIQPWCVSRQLWWGHRIPAWYGPKRLDDGTLVVNPKSPHGQHIFVCETEDEAKAQAQVLYGDGVQIEVLDHATTSEDYLNGYNHTTYIYRDEDVLDTWFSSALWPFATLGWPEEANPPRNGEVAARSADGGVETSPQTETQDDGARPLHHPPGGPPPRSGEDLVSRHYPNDLLISGFDILFFWDARMAMQGIHFMKDVPWKRLYLHGLVRAADGQKMSKSKGNVVDPLGLIDKYGADALRFFMAAMESQGRDVKMDEKRVEGYRNFATKLWNAARFCQSNGIGASTSVTAPKATLAVNKWIIGEVVETLAELDKAMADLRFDAAANAIYHFVWDQFCDWYLELIKPQLNPPRNGEVAARSADGGAETSPQTETQDDGARPLHHPAGGPPPRSGEDETRAVAGWVLDQILVMLHPFMPFVTEELWSKMGARDYELILAKWPEPEASVDTAAKAEVEWVIAFVRELRSARAELEVPVNAKTEILVLNDQKLVDFKVEQGERYDLIDTFRRFGPAFARLTRSDIVQFISTGTAFDLQTGKNLDRAKYSTEKTRGFTMVVGGATFHIPLEGVIDFDVANARLEKALAVSQKEAKSLEGRLSNPSFVEKAKPEAVEKARADHATHAAEAERLAAALKRLG